MIRRFFLTSVTVAITVSTGCGGSQPPIGAPGAMPQIRAIAQQAARGRSWMLPEASGEDLIYATNGCDGTCVISYPSGQLVGSLPVGSGFTTGDCADSAGNVYISNGTTVVEYPHGVTVPVTTFYLPGSDAKGCSVDPATGDLAVIFSGQQAGVAIFPEGQETPETFGAGISAYSCGYDDQGNLFVSGTNGQAPGLSELPSGGSSFSVLSVSSKVGRPGQVQWDGQYLSYQGTTKGRARLTQLRIVGSKAVIVKQIRLKRISGNSYFSWISNKVALVPFATHGLHARNIGVFNYPTGGLPIQVLKHVTKAPNFQAVALSVASSDLPARH